MILAILNQKGGAGKTVLSTNLAVAFQKSGAEVLLVDSDFQGSCVLWRALSPEGYPKVVHATTPGAIREATRASQAPVTILDGAAQVQEPMSKAIALATHVLIPVTPSALDMWAAEPVLEEARQRQRRSGLKVALVINQFERHTNISGDIAQALLQVAPDIPVLPTRVAKRVAYREAVSQGLSVLDLARARSAAEEILSLANDILGL
ncbi:MAG: ParA family partition ATPase [Rhodothermales bacterium]